VARGELEVEVPAARNDELGRLARAFNAMTHGLLEARRREEEQRSRREELEAKMRTVQTLAAAGEIAASLAHEIGSPLNVILGRARMIADRPDTSETTRADLKSIAAQTERITRSIEGFLRVGRPSHATASVVDVQEVVDETLAFLASEARKRGIAIRVVRAAATDAPVEAGPRVLADRDQLTQIVFNLCLNAMQAQPGGGQLEVRLSRATENDRPMVELAVSDGGPGVPAEIRGRIFDPFFSTKRTEGGKAARGDGGSGLGLAIVDGMVRELGGTVDADDADPSAGGGARFRVRLPAIASTSAGPGVAGVGSSDATGNAAAATPPASTSEVPT
jgi:signal transduction histidine kinase